MSESMSQQPVILCGSLRHIGLPLPESAERQYGQDHTSLIDELEELYQSLGYFMDCGCEAEGVDRAGGAKRFRMRDARGSIIVTYVMTHLPITELQRLISLLPGLHVCLEGSPKDLEALLDHPNFERGPISWGRGSKSVFLIDPLGYEIEIQLINCPD